SALQGEVFQQRLPATLAFGSELFRRIFECLEDGRSGFCLRILRGVEPRSQCLGARSKACWGLPVAGSRRDARQVVVKRRAMVEGVAEPDKSRPDRAQIGGFQRERLEEVLDLLGPLDVWLVLDGFAGKLPADGIDCASGDPQDRPPGSLER